MEVNFINAIRTKFLKHTRYGKTPAGRKRYIKDSLNPKRTGIKFFYLFAGLTGIVGATCIAIKIFSLKSVSCFGMILWFGAFSVSLLIVLLSLFGFNELIREEDQK